MRGLELVVRNDLPIAEQIGAPILEVYPNQLWYSQGLTMKMDSLEQLAEHVEYDALKAREERRAANVLVEIDASVHWADVVSIADVLARSGVQHVMFVFEGGPAHEPRFFNASIATAIPGRGRKIALPAGTEWREASQQFTAAEETVSFGVL